MKKILWILLIVLTVFGFILCRPHEEKIGTGQTIEANEQREMESQQKKEEGGSDMKQPIEGNYQGIPESNAENNKWHLYIGTHENRDNFFTIYDNGGKVGNEEHPWIVGWIDRIEKDCLVIGIDEELFASIPSDWQAENGKLTLAYEKTGDILTLTNGECAMQFQEKQYAVNVRNGLEF